MKTRLRNRSRQEGGSAVKGIVLVTAVVTMLMVFITTLTSCDMQQQEIQGDKAKDVYKRQVQKAT